ncbi:reverse transcriptase [Caerostris extrusa]|uniref:Reverse transcriptase n=1 Tax=Caerostris extrusa TaxID=172846 RepID=A0AAV4MU26_CAEEX|nr:reverse transcriptase [Caerostris extrusa]
MMYCMILIDPSHHKLQRIRWKKSEHEPQKTYELVTVTYGTVSAPDLAMRTLKQLANDEEKNFPIGAPVIRNDFYMDDVLCGAQTLKEAKEL